jgi:hypothetical protein
MSAGFTLSALWTIRDIPRGVLGGNAKCVLNALVSFASASGHIEVDVLRLSGAADMGKTTLMRELERLVMLGAVTILRRGTGSASSVYRVELERLQAMKEFDAPPVRSQSPRGVSLPSDDVKLAVPGSYSERGGELPRVGKSLVPGWEAGGSGLGTIEDLEDRYEDLQEDHASQPSHATMPTTSRSPSIPASPTVEADPWGLTPTPAPEATPVKLRKPATKKPRPALPALTVDVLTDRERAVHDAILHDETLVLVCADVPRLARDLVSSAPHVDIVREVAKAGNWNRIPDNKKAWSIGGGNRGLLNWIARASAQDPSGYPQARPAYQHVPANHDPAPSPPRQKIYAPPPPPKPVLLSSDGETFLERLARTDPVARAMINKIKEKDCENGN